jgi:hypothetical protein
LGSVGATLRASGRRSTLADDADPGDEDGDAVKLDKQELLKLLRTQGDNETADKAESELPDEIDTDQDGAALDALGLDRTQLMAKLAGGGFGTTLTP